MEQVEELLARYEKLAEKERESRTSAKRGLMELVDQICRKEDFEVRLQEAAWSSCVKKHDSEALRKANGGTLPGKHYWKTLREDGVYCSEISRLVHKDPLYIQAQKSRKHPEEFLTPQGMKLLRKLLPEEDKSRFDDYAGELKKRSDSNFVTEYLDTVTPEIYEAEILHNAEKLADGRFSRTRSISDGNLRDMMAGRMGKDERELLIYRVLDAGSFSELADFAIEAMTSVFPCFTRAEALAEELGLARQLRNGLRCVVENTGLDCRLSERLLSVYTPERILSIAKRNPYCSSAIRGEIASWEKEERHRTELRFNMVTAMPDSYKDLYPATRIMRRHFVIHSGPTNSGKTYDGMQALMKHENGVYLAPLRMLALEKSDELIEAGFPCDLRTGEEERLIDGAAFVSSTIELADLTRQYQCAVIDECQMMTDPVRGGAWTAAVLGIQAEEIHICLSPWAEDIVIPLIEDCGDSYELVRHERATPLTAERHPVSFPDGIREYDALIAFSRRSVHAIASRLEQAGKKCSVIYGNLPYDVRQNEAAKFRRRETKIVVATDAIGMGLNLPVRRVIFMETEKYDGRELRRLESEEIRQIAGRAGRRGIFEEGFAGALDEEFLNDIAGAIYHYRTEHEVPMFGFPRQLLGIDSHVSVLMKEWMAIPPLPGFQKADLSEQILLAEKAEEFIEDKSVVYRLSMIPFDTSDESLLELWTMLTKTLARGFLDNVYVPPMEPSEKLLELEHRSRCYDIYFHFGRLFEIADLKKEAMEQKNAVSKRIIELLDARGKEIRRCAGCGCVLSWNYPYKICENCHQKLSGYRVRTKRRYR